MMWLFWVSGLAIILSAEGELDLILGSIWMIIGYLDNLSDILSKRRE